MVACVNFLWDVLIRNDDFASICIFIKIVNEERFQMIDIFSNGILGESAHRINQIPRCRPYCLDKNIFLITIYAMHYFQAPVLFARNDFN